VLKPEIAVAPGAGGRLLISAPVEGSEGVVAGMLQLEAVPYAAALTPPPWWRAILFALAPLVVLAGVAPLLRRRRPWIAIASAVLLLVLTMLAYREYSTRALYGGMRATEERMAAAVTAEQKLVRNIAPGTAAGAWDGDAYRRPREVDIAATLAGQVEAVDSAAWGALAAGLVLLLLIALGFAERSRAALVRNRRAYAYVAPAMLGMLLLVFFPFIFGVVLSFTSQNVYTVNAPLREIWVGLDNYRDILGDFTIIRHTAEGRAANYQNFYWTLFHTVLWTIANVTIGVTVGLTLALILNIRAFRFKAVYRVLLILPWAIPNYITALIWRGMFHQQFGVINQVIQIFGGHPVSWFETPWTSFAAIVATNGWLSFPFMMIVSLGALQSIPADLYEAARVDGATRWQQFRSITLPSLKPALVPAIILSVVWTFNMFNIPYLVSAGEPAGSTEILITQAYKIAFEQYRYGYAAAYSTIIFAILLIYGVFQNRVTRATESIA
jgi:arabinogalactan oligomer/maltooligosaccharide transport system permease protein